MPFPVSPPSATLNLPLRSLLQVPEPRMRFYEVLCRGFFKSTLPHYNRFDHLLLSFFKDYCI
ncbi:hypothetical protein RND71_033726 [Anisodus tanguticus]|uniref:Uncharacterized protein n=1 Tax=Anisodus tanguticus TaxID=243964 RepID=A0AAE1RBE6_9SOLA|nr:hypothetical protein RND71_033726 [Anisodus tanguticus]